MSDQFTHCDDFMDDRSNCDVARWFIFIERLDAMTRGLADRRGCNPRLFADYEGRRVRVVMASRLGDLGITYDLASDTGYSKRVWIDHLFNFSENP